MESLVDLRVPDGEIDEDWEEWDPNKSSFRHHVIAGSAAGLMEHVFMFPVDTVKTHMQAKAGPQSGLALTRTLAAEAGYGRLWRGVTPMFVACVPAHAAYFGIFESVKGTLTEGKEGNFPLAFALAGSLSATAHDAVITPLDVCKQRLQLGMYRGFGDCVRSIAKNEGLAAFYVSFPTTLMMNIPYGACMATVNETVKNALNPMGVQNFWAFMVSGAVAGATAATVTCPLDVIKTRLQTSRVVESSAMGSGEAGASSSAAAAVAKAAGGSGVGGPSASATDKVVSALKKAKRATGGARITAPSFSAYQVAAMQSSANGSANGGRLGFAAIPRGTVAAAKQIFATEGLRGFFRGLAPRVLFHTPSVAICWSTYETIKRTLQAIEPAA